jgi:hypothetical protein
MLHVWPIGSDSITDMLNEHRKQLPPGFSKVRAHDFFWLVFINIFRFCNYAVSVLPHGILRQLRLPTTVNCRLS